MFRDGNAPFHVIWRGYLHPACTLLRHAQRTCMRQTRHGGGYPYCSPPHRHQAPRHPGMIHHWKAPIFVCISRILHALITTHPAAWRPWQDNGSNGGKVHLTMQRAPISSPRHRNPPCGMYNMHEGCANANPGGSVQQHGGYLGWVDGDNMAAAHLSPLISPFPRMLHE